MKLGLVLAGAAVVGVAAGCYSTEKPPSAEEQAAEHPLAGLFTPESEIGLTVERRNAIAAEMAAAGASAQSKDEKALQDSIAMGGDRCTGPAGTPGTPGTLQISFTSAGYTPSKYGPANCGAIWIEDTTGKYVATPAIWALLRKRPLFFWQARRCKQDEPDAITSATLDTHRAHSVMWDGKDLKGNVAPDGMYVLKIEVTEDEVALGRIGDFPFVKGTEPMTLMPPDTESVRGLKLVYTPQPTTPGATMPTGG
jgi:hypothetical protein